MHILPEVFSEILDDSDDLATEVLLLLINLVWRQLRLDWHFLLPLFLLFGVTNQDLDEAARLRKQGAVDGIVLKRLILQPAGPLLDIDLHLMIRLRDVEVLYQELVVILSSGGRCRDLRAHIYLHILQR